MTMVKRFNWQCQKKTFKYLRATSQLCTVKIVPFLEVKMSRKVNRCNKRFSQNRKISQSLALALSNYGATAICLIASRCYTEVSYNSQKWASGVAKRLSKTQ